MMYDELVKQLKYCADDSNPICEITAVCPFYDQREEETHYYLCVERMMSKAADAIEELQKDLERSNDFEAFWQHEAEEVLKKFQVTISNKPRWIPVTERLPNGEEDVLVTDGDACAVGFYRRDANAWDSCEFGWIENRPEPFP